MPQRRINTTLYPARPAQRAAPQKASVWRAGLFPAPAGREGVKERACKVLCASWAMAACLGVAPGVQPGFGAVMPPPEHSSCGLLSGWR